MKKTGSILAGLLSLAVAAPYAAFATPYAASAAPNAAAHGSIGIELNGFEAAPPADQQPFMRNHRVLVPVRYLFEALGADVHYDDATRTVIGRKGDATIALPIGTNRMQVGDRSVAVDAPATIANGRTFVPIRAVAEALGTSVAWDARRNVVRVATPMLRGALPSVSALAEDRLRAARELRAYDTADLALQHFYAEAAIVPVFAEELASIDLSAEVGPIDLLYTAAGDIVETENGYTFEFRVAGRDPHGVIRNLGYDIVEVASLGDGMGYAVTGYAHVRTPGSDANSPSVWIGRGADSTIMPEEWTDSVPPVLIRDNRVLLPTELLKPFGHFTTRTDGVTLTLPDGSTVELPIARANGAAYVDLDRVAAAVDGKSFFSPEGMSTHRYDIVWHAGARQLILQIEIEHPIS